MSLPTDGIYRRPDNQTYEPLPDGKYYLVDISEPLREYMQLPMDARMCGVSDGDGCFTADDMLDVELSAIIPCLDGKQEAQREIAEHVKNLLEDGREHLAFLLQEEGVDTDARTIPNTHAQLTHAKAINELASQLADTFIEHRLYSESGQLMGDYCTLLDGGILALREK